MDWKFWIVFIVLMAIGIVFILIAIATGLFII